MQYYDYIKLEAELKNYFIDDEFNYVAIINDKNQVVAKYIKNEVNDGLYDQVIIYGYQIDPTLVHNNKNDSILFSTKIFDQPSNIIWGSVYLSLSKKIVFAQVAQQLLILIIGGMIALIVELAVLQYLTKRITNPISKITKLSKAIASDHNLSLFENYIRYQQKVS